MVFSESLKLTYFRMVDESDQSQFDHNQPIYQQQYMSVDENLSFKGGSLSIKYSDIYIQSNTSYEQYI